MAHTELALVRNYEKLDSIMCREGFFILPYNELAIGQGPKIHQKKEL